ncbi:MAG: hypothetical protein ACT4NY_16755 [Pseudonocardiales bacterium]
MSDVVSFTEIYSQHVELLPGRTLLRTIAPVDGPVDTHVDDGRGGVRDDGGFDKFGGVDDNGTK